MQAHELVRVSPARRSVGSFPRLIDARHAMSYLEGQKFPIERVTIVAEGIRPATPVSTQTGRWQAVVDGAISGAVTGVLLAFFLDLVGWMALLTSGFMLGIGGLVFGLIVGAIVGLILHAFTGERRAPTSTLGIEAEHYSVMVDDEEADLAARLIGRVW